MSNTVDFEKNLVPGTLVLACWTNSNKQHRAFARVVRVNGASVRVELVDQIAGLFPSGAQVVFGFGRQLVLPLIGGRGWSVRNRVVGV